MAEALLITDPFGMLHVVPTGNRDFYESRNRVNTTQQYGIKEMDEAEALQFVQDNKGVDPGFTPPAQQQNVINTQQEELDRLRKALADSDAEAQKLKEQLNTLSTASTSSTDYSKEAEAQAPKNTTKK